MDNNSTETLLTPNEVAKLLHVSPVTVRHWALAGKLRYSTTPGGHRRFSQADVMAFKRDYSLLKHSDNKTVLVIEDDEQHAKYLQTIIQKTLPHIEVAIANSGFEAAHLLHHVNPDLIILDLMMPGMDGFMVCRHITQDPVTRHIPVFAMTGYPTHDNIKKIINAGAVNCLSKPIDAVRLRQILKEFLAETPDRVKA